MKTRRLLLAAFCASFIILCFAGQAAAKDTWTSVRTKNFFLIGDASEKDIRQVATKLEQFRETFRQLFPGIKLSSPIQTNVIVFKSSSSYKPYKPKRADGKSDEWIAGYFQSGEDVNYITLSTEGEKEDTYGIIFHEYVHYMLDTTFGRSEVPPWFNEGLAEFYQMFQIKEDQKVILGNLQEGHLMRLRETKLMPLKQFFEIDNYSLHRNGNHSRSIFYAQAWALIHYLIQGNGGANNKSLGRFLVQVMDKVEPEKAFQKEFGRDYAAMEKELKKYVEQRSFVGTIVTLKEKLVFDNEMTATPMSEAAANAYLGDLLYHTREYPAAETHLQKALTLDPNLSMAHTSLGLVKMRQRNFPEAKKFLEKAIADDQKNHYAHYNYAYILSRESMDEFGYASAFPADSVLKMRASLKRSIDLNPAFPESYRLLAWIHLVSGENLDEALAVLKKGLVLQPGNQDYALLAAQILMRQQKFDDARTIAEKLAKTASDEQMRTNAAKIVDSIDQYSAAKMSSEQQFASLESQGYKRPVLIKRESMTDEEFAKLEREREIRSLNQVLDKPEEGEKQFIGTVESIKCVKGEISYTVKSDAGPMMLTSKDFQNLRLTILLDGTSDVAVGCDADIKKDLVVITYKPAADSKPNTKGILTGLAFVPKDFRLMTAAEIANAPNIIVQGGPPADLEKNAKTAAAEMAEMETRRREMMMQQIERSLRRSADGETRMIGIVEKIECSGKNITVLINNGTGVIKLKSPPPNELKLAAFTQDAAGQQFGCGVSIPNISAVITYRSNNDPKAKIAGDLVAIEFVPKSFQLPAEN